HKLKDLTANWSGTPLVVFVDDIHKIADDEDIVCDVINDFASVLGNNVHLVTAGQISIPSDSIVEEFRLNLYTRDETQVFLEASFDEVTEDHVHDVHTAVE
ncbi:hypothetical protein C495_01015, partial [Natronorubrum sulfidifaciens JCM 14089]